MPILTDNIEQLIRDSQAKAKHEREESAESMDAAVAYARGEMKEDTESQIAMKYRERQATQDARIEAVTIPVVQFFLDETATAYTHGVQRELVTEDGTVDEEETKRYTDALAEINYDQIMEQVDRRLVLLRNTTTLFTEESGKLDVRVQDVQDVFPIAPDRAHNPANQDAYEGWVIDTRDHLKVGDATRRTFLLIRPEGHVTYTSKDGNPHKIAEVLDESENPFVWNGEQLQMLQVWHGYQPIDDVFHLFEPSMLTANRKLNTQWSVLHDVFNFQAGATPVKSVDDPVGESPNQPVGVLFPQVISVNESFDYAVASNDWDSLVKFLQSFVKIVGMMERMAPDDFSLDGGDVKSGFAKVVENMPKMRARDRRIKMLKLGEEKAWPRQAAVMMKTKQLTKRAQRLNLKVTFEAPRMPKSVEERTKEEEHDLKLGLTTPAQILAERSGMSLEEAREQIEQNLEETREQRGSMNGQQPPQSRSGGAFARLINQPGRQDQEQGNEEEDDLG